MNNASPEFEITLKAHPLQLNKLHQESGRSSKMKKNYTTNDCEEIIEESIVPLNSDDLRLQMDTIRQKITLN